jgi:hypothetical protein
MVAMKRQGHAFIGRGTIDKIWEKDTFEVWLGKGK